MSIQPAMKTQISKENFESSTHQNPENIVKFEKATIFFMNVGNFIGYGFIDKNFKITWRTAVLYDLL